MKRSIPLVLGIALYVSLSHMILNLSFDSSNPFSGAIFPALFIPLCFGILFGPWYGFLVGGLGYLSSYVLDAYLHGPFVYGDVSIGLLQIHYTNYFHGFPGLGGPGLLPYILNYYMYHLPFNWVLGTALIGLIAGCARRELLGGYTTIRATVLACVLGIAALIIGTDFSIYTQVAIWNANHDDTVWYFSPAYVFLEPPQLIIAAMLSPLLLIVWNVALRNGVRPPSL